LAIPLTCHFFSIRYDSKLLRIRSILRRLRIDCGSFFPLFVATPQQALLQTMAAMHAKAQEITGVEVPKFYNPAAVNPLKYAEQMQKRKLLWSKAAENKDHTLQQFQVH